MKISDRLGKIESRLDSIDSNLDRHMKRCDAIEKQVQPMLELRAELKGIVKFFKFIGLLAGIIECLRLVLR